MQPDARRADAQVVNQDAIIERSDDLVATDSGAHPDSREVARQDAIAIQPDTGIVIAADGALSEGDSHLAESQDASPPNVLASDAATSDAARPLSVDTMLADAKLADAKVADTMPVDPMLADAMPVDTTPADPVDPMLADAMPVDTMPADTAGWPVDTGSSTDTGTVDTASAPDTAWIEIVTFSNGKAVGAMSGNGWVSLGIQDSLTSPTCGSQPITGSTNCSSDSITWDADALCISGEIPALSSSPTATEYSENWGLKVGANANQAQGPLGLTFSTIAFHITGTPSTGLRAVVHLSGTGSEGTYCANVTSDVPIPVTDFSTSCWDNQGTHLTADDGAKIDHMGIQVPSSGQATTVTSLCLSSITFVH